MEIGKISNYSDFLSHIEYPAVVFCEDGEVLSINNAAVRLIGNQVDSITMVPDKFMSSDEFWPILNEKKTIIWHRLLLKINNKRRLVVSGFVNQFEYNDKKAYMILFELRSDVAIGSMSLERIINHAGILALYLYKPDSRWQTRYVTKNIAEYGYEEEAFYNGTIGLRDIIVKNDYDILIGNLYKADNTGNTDFEMKVRFVTPDSAILSMQLKCHVVRSPEGDADGIELLFVKNKKPSLDEEKSSYILSVMNKIKSFVMVKSIGNGKSQLKYITSNAKLMGMNVEALMAGNKLTEDYIHPQDRARVIQNAKNLLKTGGSDYEDEYRIVDDFGNVRWVKSQNSITQAGDSTYTIEFFITDITENKKLRNSVEEAKKEYENKLSYIMNSNVDEGEYDSYSIDKEKWTNIVKAFADLSGLYSTVVSPDGQQLVEPAGPKANMGSFYDLFEKPQYKDMIVKLNDAILQNNVPVMMEMEDDNNGGMICGAPVKIGDKHVATWIMCGYDTADIPKMKRVYKIQWNMCNIFSEYAYNGKVLSKEAERSKSMEMLLEEKIQKQKILTEALSAMGDDDNKTISNILEKTGECLGIDVMVIYSLNENQEYMCSYIWSREKSMTAEEYIEQWQKGKKFFTHSKERAFDCIIADKNHAHKEFQQNMELIGVTSFAALSIEINDIISGCIVMANNRNEKEWADGDIEFSKDIRNVIQGILSKIEGDGNIRMVNKLLVDTYNYINIGIFIRDEETGEVLFSNQPLNDMLGYDFTGKNSKTLIRDLNDTFKGVTTVQKPFLTERKEVSWRSYIKQFDKIMDLSEVSMKWLDGRKASLVILRDVQD